MKELIIKKGDKQITVADKEDVMDALNNKVSTDDNISANKVSYTRGLTTSDNLDNLITTGRYYADASTMTSLTDGEIISGSIIEVIQWSNYTTIVSQRIYTLSTNNTNNKIYYRVKHTNWSNWIQIDNGYDYSCTVSGTGYMEIFQIKLKGNYPSMPITFDIYQKQKSVYHCSLLFTNTTQANVNISSFTYTGAHEQEIYAYKVADYTWNILIKKTETNDAIKATNIQTGFQYMGSKIDISRVNNLLSDKPSSNLTQATYLGFTSTEKTKLAGIATGATNNIVTDNLTTDSSTNALSAKQGKWLYDNKASNTHNHDGTYIKTGTGTVTSTNIADGTIVNGDIANTTITGGKLVNGTVTATQLASNAVTSAKIADGTITDADIADYSVTNLKLEGHSINQSEPSGYLKLMKIKVNGAYQDSPLKFEIYCRGYTEPIICNVKFENANSTDPGVASFTTKGFEKPVYLYKESTSTWSVIVQKNRYDGFTITYVGKGDYNTCEVSKMEELLSELPTSTTTNPRITGNYIGFTSTEKTKLSGIATGATKNTVSDSLTDSSTTNALSANKGKWLNDNKASSTHTHSYLPLSGGTMTGGIIYPQIRTITQGNDNIPWSGAITWDTDILTTLKARKSLIGTTVDSNSKWWNIISVRHRNGTGDGNSWGMYIKSALTGDGDLIWAKDLNGNAFAERTILDSNNYSQYANKTTVDSALNSSSTNPVQNKVINTALNEKANSSHAHGNITNAGAIGSTANVPIITGNSGVLKAGSFGTAANTFCQGNDSRLSNERTPAFVHIDATSSAPKNLNDYKTGGFYFCSHDTNEAPYISNCPLTSSNRAFFLLVETWGTTSTYVKQTLTYYNTNTTYTRICAGGTWGAWVALIKEGDSRLTNARTPTSHTHGNLQNNGQVGSTVQENKNVVTDSSGKITTENKIPAPSTSTLSFVNNTMMSGTVKITEKNGWATVYYENVKCTTVHDGYTQFCALPHNAAAKIYAEMNFNNINNAIVFRVNENYLEGRCLKANQAQYGHISFPLAGNN